MATAIAVAPACLYFETRRGGKEEEGENKEEKEKKNIRRKEMKTNLTEGVCVCNKTLFNRNRLQKLWIPTCYRREFLSSFFLFLFFLIFSFYFLFLFFLFFSFSFSFSFFFIFSFSLLPPKISPTPTPRTAGELPAIPTSHPLSR